MAHGVDGVSGRRAAKSPVPGPKRIRGGSGLGDSLYARPIVDHFVRAGDQVTVCSDYPDVFIGSGATVERFGRDRINVLAHYVGGKANPTTTQWDDVCASAHVRAPLAFPWQVRNAALIARLREQANGRRLVLVHGGRAPMARTDGFGRELLPERAAFEAVLGALSDAFLVGVGNASPIYPLPVHVDMNGGTSVADLLDLGASCDAVVAQCSFAVPLAEVFDRPLLAVWSAAGLASREPYIRQITPRKILCKPTSRHVVDDWSPARLTEAAHALCHS